MLTPRDTFLSQFTSTILVRGTQGWQFRLIKPPEWFPGSLYDAMKTCNGKFSVTRCEFYDAIWPLVVEVHEAGRKAKERRPDASAFAGRLYDVMSQAGIEVTIGPPVEAHGHRFGQGHSA